MIWFEEDTWGTQIAFLVTAPEGTTEPSPQTSISAWQGRDTERLWVLWAGFYMQHWSLVPKCILYFFSVIDFSETYAAEPGIPYSVSLFARVSWKDSFASPLG